MTSTTSRPPRLAILALVVLALAGGWWLSQRSGDKAARTGGAPTFTNLSTSRQQQQKAERDQLLDPSQDGWGTEAFADKATKQLKSVAKLLAHPSELTAASLANIAADDFSCGHLRPDDLTTVFEDRTIKVRRPASDGADNTNDPSNSDAETDAKYVGPGGLAEALREMISGLDAATDPQVAVKVFFVELPDGEADSQQITTSVYVESSAETSSGHAQQNAAWRCRWKVTEADSQPRLLAIEVIEYEESSLKKGQSGSLFADYTEAGLGKETSYRQQIRYGNNHWGGVIDRTLGIRLRGYHGLAVGDVNGDGLEDMYVCEPGALPNRLFLQRSDGSFHDVSADSGVDFLDPVSSALLVDLDNDGDQDLVIASINAIAILSNDGQGRFEIRALLDGGEAFQPTAADYDSDGDLDLYIPMYEPFGHEDSVIAGAPIAIPYHDANNGKPNVLYRNDGNWRFTDVTDSVGLDQNNSKFSLAATWEDIDLDGDQDLYVANDFGRNNLYRYDAETGKFTDIAGPAGVEDMSTGMSASFGDYNRDGLPDLYVSNMWSSAGNRITYQRQFREEQSDEVKSQFQYLARGNSLFENAGDSTFRDVSIAAGVTMGRWAWGSVFADINNDGWEDILVANGYITGSQPSDL